MSPAVRICRDILPLPIKTDKDLLKSLKQEAKAEKQEYSQLKKMRWHYLPTR